MPAAAEAEAPLLAPVQEENTTHDDVERQCTVRRRSQQGRLQFTGTEDINLTFARFEHRNLDYVLSSEEFYRRIRGESVGLLSKLSLLLHKSTKQFVFLVLGTLCVIIYLFGSAYSVEAPTCKSMHDPLTFSVANTFTLGALTLRFLGKSGCIGIAIVGFVHGAVTLATLIAVLFSFKRYKQEAFHAQHNMTIVISKYLLFGSRFKKAGRGSGCHTLTFRLANINENLVGPLTVYFMVIDPKVYRPEQATCGADNISIGCSCLKIEEAANNTIFPIVPTEYSHVIDQHSPLYGMTLQEIQGTGLEFLVLVYALSSDHKQRSLARSTFISEDLVQGNHFCGMSCPDIDSDRIPLDFMNFNRVESNSTAKVGLKGRSSTRGTSSGFQGHAPHSLQSLYVSKEDVRWKRELAGLCKQVLEDDGASESLQLAAEHLSTCLAREEGLDLSTMI